MPMTEEAAAQLRKMDPDATVQISDPQSFYARASPYRPPPMRNGGFGDRHVRPGEYIKLDAPSVPSDDFSINFFSRAHQNLVNY